MADWEEFHQRRGPGAEGPAVDDEFDAICATALGGVAGQRLIEALRRRHFESGGNAMAPEAVLRVRAAHQQMIRDLEMARDRGNEAAKKRAEASRKTD
jgi:hypothetical protein